MGCKMSALKGQVKASSGDGEFVQELPEPDTYPAVVCAVVDLGTHTKKAFGSDAFEDVPLALVAFQLGENKSDGTPHVVMQEYRASCHVKSKLYDLACKVFRRKLGEGEPIDYFAMVGQPCSVTVAHGETAKGRKYARIDAVGSIGRGMIPPKPAQTAKYEIDQGDPKDTLDWLPYHFGKPVAEHISLSHERQGTQGLKTRNDLPNGDAGERF